MVVEDAQGRLWEADHEGTAVPQSPPSPNLSGSVTIRNAVPSDMHNVLKYILCLNTYLLVFLLRRKEINLNFVNCEMSRKRRDSLLLYNSAISNEK